MLAQLIGATPAAAAATAEVAIPPTTSSPKKPSETASKSPSAEATAAAATASLLASLSIVPANAHPAPATTATPSPTTPPAIPPSAVAPSIATPFTGTPPTGSNTLLDDPTAIASIAAPAGSAIPSALLTTLLQPGDAKATDLSNQNTPPVTPPADPLSANASVPTVGDLTAVLRDAIARALEATALPNATAQITDSAPEGAKAPTIADDASAMLSANLNSSVQASQLHAAAQARANGDTPPPAALSSPVGTPAWHDELGNQLMMMAHQGLDSASLRLSPEHLGPLEVRISMQDGNTSVWFGATNADTRAALDQSLPRLREMFASQGMNLTDSGVFRDAPGDKRLAPPSLFNSRSAVDSGEVATVSRAAARSLQLLDTYV